MSLFLCLVLWCALGKAPEGAVNPPPFTLSLGQDTYSKNEFTERFVLGEHYRVFAGGVFGGGQLLAVAGYFPLRVTLGPLRVEGGVSLATAPLPHRGTKANWAARAGLTLVGPLTLEWWHFSNARSAIPNPSLDALAVAFRWTPGGPQSPKWEPKPTR